MIGDEESNGNHGLAFYQKLQNLALFNRSMVGLEGAHLAILNGMFTIADIVISNPD